METKIIAADKTPDPPDAKTIKENVKEGFVDDLASAFDGNNLEDSELNGVSSLLKMQESRSFKGLESVLDYLDKNEKRGFGDDGLETYLLDANEWNIEDDDDDREGELAIADDQFRVGDFVWGKIRTHPWWPGRIYDPLDASDYAKKLKRRDKILVAYFGDGTFAWCNPSQLSPFEENFGEMFKQSNSKSFANAVEEGVDEVGRLVDLRMTCSCVPQENLIGFGRSLAVNAGIKEGLLVPEGGIDKFSTALFEPAAFLPVLKDVAQVAKTANMLEFSVLKNWLSAFYRAKGGYKLPTYHEPQPIPGLEDDTRNWMDLTDYSGGVEARIQGPVEEDWPSSSTGRKFGQTTQGCLQKCQDMLEGRQYRRRKQKSMAEILRGDTDAEAENKEEDVTKEETESRKQSYSAKRKTEKGRCKIMGQEMDATIQNVMVGVSKDKASSATPASSSGRKRRKGGGEVDGEGKYKLGPLANTGTNLDKHASSSGREKRKSSDEADAEDETKVGDVGEAGIDSGKPECSFGRKKWKVSDKANDDCKNEVRNVAKVGSNSEKSASSSGRKKREVNDEANADGGNDSVSRLRKETALSESSVAAEKKASDLEVGGCWVMQKSRKSPLSSRRKKGSSAAENDDSEGNIEETRVSTLSAGKKMDGGLHQIAKGLFSRERRQSKYLSSPYTNINIGRRKKKLEAESYKISSQVQLGERMTKAAGHLICDKFQMKSYEETSGGHQTSDHTGPQTPKQDQNNIIDLIKVKAPVNQVLSRVQSLAVNLTYLKEGKSHDMVEEFVSAFRSSIYSNGSNYKMYNKHQKSQESEPGTSGVKQNQADQSSADYKSQKSEESKLVKLKVRQAASVTDVKTNDKESDGKALAAAALYVTFSLGSSLPSKNDLLMIYEKFGSLNQEETKMFYKRRCARIVFLRSSEAEEAFNDSQFASPFVAASVTFQLRYLSAENKIRKLIQIPSTKSSPLAKDKANLDKEFASQSSPNDASQLNYIKQKLEMMSSILEMSDGTDMKSKLEGEIKGLLEKVSTMVGSSV